jgi:predicted dehydrogenase
MAASNAHRRGGRKWWDDRWGARARRPSPRWKKRTGRCCWREETAKRARQRAGARLAFWDYQEMMHSPEVDLVTVAVHRVTLSCGDGGAGRGQACIL